MGEDEKEKKEREEKRKRRRTHGCHDDLYSEIEWKGNRVLIGIEDCETHLSSVMKERLLHRETMTSRSEQY